MPVFHVWFATKRRKWLIQGDVLDAVRLEIKLASERHDVRLIEYEAIVDHVHLLIECPEPLLSKQVGVVKGASARAMFERFPELKMDAEIQHFWQASFGRKLVPREALANTKRYIQTQWERLEGFDR